MDTLFLIVMLIEANEISVEKLCILCKWYCFSWAQTVHSCFDSSWWSIIFIDKFCHIVWEWSAVFLLLCIVDVCAASLVDGCLTSYIHILRCNICTWQRYNKAKNPNFICSNVFEVFFFFFCYNLSLEVDQLLVHSWHVKEGNQTGKIQGTRC